MGWGGVVGGKPTAALLCNTPVSSCRALSASVLVCPLPTVPCSSWTGRLVIEAGPVGFGCPPVSVGPAVGY